MPKKFASTSVYESLKELHNYAIGVAFFVTSVFLSWNEFAALWNVDPTHFALAILLALVTFTLFVLYIIATHIELKLLNDYLGDNLISRIGPKVYLVSFGLAILFSVLFASCRNLFIYAAIMVCYNLFDLWGSTEVLKKIGTPFEKKMSQAKSSVVKDRLQLLRSFYFEHPTLPRIVTIMFVNWIVVCLGLTFLLTANTLFRDVGYILLLLNIIGGEVVIHKWRVRSIYKL